jgi:MmyB-like transcription regulator ligand binding domain
VLDRLSDTPALILSNLGETLVQNQMAEALLGDRSGYTGLARSEIYRWFTDPAERRLRYHEDDRDRQSRAQVANLRAAYGSMGPKSRAGELVRALQKTSTEFAALWERHEVRGLRKAAVARRARPSALRRDTARLARVLPSTDYGQSASAAVGTPSTDAEPSVAS